MKLGMDQTLTLRIDCDCCTGTMGSGDPDDHEPGCPRPRMLAAIEARKEWTCPQCRGTCEINDADFFECRKCRSVFSGGASGDERVKPVVMLPRFDCGVLDVPMVRKLPGVGRRRFKYDAIMAVYTKRVREAQARMKKIRK